MKKKVKQIIYIIIWYFSIFSSSFADWWILWDFAKSRSWSGNNDTQKALREWDIHLEDIPVMIRSAIDFLMTIAWTIAIIFIIVWAYKILFGSLEQDKTKWKDTIIMALLWFALASSAWFIVKLILDNLSA